MHLSSVRGPSLRCRPSQQTRRSVLIVKASLTDHSITRWHTTRRGVLIGLSGFAAALLIPSPPQSLADSIPAGSDITSAAESQLGGPAPPPADKLGQSDVAPSTSTPSTSNPANGSSPAAPPSSSSTTTSRITPMDDATLTDEAARRLLIEEEERRRRRKKSQGRLKELEEIRIELAEKELALLEKEKALLAKEQTLVVLEEEIEVERKLRALLTKEKERAEEEAALAMGLCMGGFSLP